MIATEIDSRASNNVSLTAYNIANAYYLVESITNMMSGKLPIICDCVWDEVKQRNSKTLRLLLLPLAMTVIFTNII